MDLKLAEIKKYFSVARCIHAKGCQAHQARGIGEIRILFYKKTLFEREGFFCALPRNINRD
jgi:hypothetical protein